MAEHLPRGEHQSLAGWVHRHIGWLLNDVETFEVDPHRVYGIRETAVRESVGREQIAELVVPGRLRHAPQRNQRDADGERVSPTATTARVFRRARRENQLRADKNGVFRFGDLFRREKNVSATAARTSSDSIISSNHGASAT